MINTGSSGSNNKLWIWIVVLIILTVFVVWMYAKYMSPKNTKSEKYTRGCSGCKGGSSAQEDIVKPQRHLGYKRVIRETPIKTKREPDRKTKSNREPFLLDRKTELKVLEEQDRADWEAPYNFCSQYMYASPSSAWPSCGIDYKYKCQRTY